jgi:hypothetical protein
MSSATQSRPALIKAANPIFPFCGRLSWLTFAALQLLEHKRAILVRSAVCKKKRPDWVGPF